MCAEKTLKQDDDVRIRRRADRLGLSFDPLVGGDLLLGEVEKQKGQVEVGSREK